MYNETKIETRESTMFRNTKIQRSIAAVVMTTFMNLSLYPLTAAVQVQHER